MNKPLNPFRQPAQVGIGGSAISRGLVVNVQDPLKAGRVQVRIVGHHDDEQGIPDDKLPWIKINNPTTTASLQTSTMTHGLLPGSMVSLNQFGDQDWIITGSIPNDRKDSEQTIHPATQGKGDTDNINAADKGSTKQKGDGSYGWPSPLKNIYESKTTREAKRLREEAGRKGRRQSDPVEESKSKSPIPDHYGNRTAGKDLQGGTIGTDKFPNAKNAQKFIQDTIQNKSAIIPSALSALEQLKKVNGNPTSIDSIGAGNFAGMLQQLAQLFGGKGGNINKEDSMKYDCEELKKMDENLLSYELKEQLRICRLIDEKLLEEESEEELLNRIESPEEPIV